MPDDTNNDCEEDYLSLETALKQAGFLSNHRRSYVGALEPNDINCPNLIPVLLISSFQENLAAQYLAKVRKLQKDLEDAEDRAETAESALNKARSRARASGGGAGVGRQTSREVSRPLSPLHHRYHSCTVLSPNSSIYSDRRNSRFSSYY